MIAIVAGRDRIIPPLRSKQLFDAWGGLRCWAEVPDADHEALRAFPAFWEAVSDFLNDRLTEAGWAELRRTHAWVVATFLVSFIAAGAAGVSKGGTTMKSATESLEGFGCPPDLAKPLAQAMDESKKDPAASRSVKWLRRDGLSALAAVGERLSHRGGCDAEVSSSFSYMEDLFRQ